MKNQYVPLVLVCVLLLFSLKAKSQIVNIEKQRSSTSDSILWTGHINLGFNLVENNKTIITVNGDMRHDFSKNRHLFLSISKYNLGKVDNEDFLNDGFQHFRYNYSLNKWMTWEAFTQIQYNERINLKMRWLLGSGPRFTLVEEDRYQLFLGTLYMYEYGRETEGESTETVVHRDHRMSNYISISLQPVDNLEFHNTSYFQPLISDFSDLRLSSESNLLIKITERLRFSSVFSIVYDSRSPEGVPSTIYRFSNGVRWEF